MEEIITHVIQQLHYRVNYTSRLGLFPAGIMSSERPEQNSKGFGAPKILNIYDRVPAMCAFTHCEPL